MPFVLRLLCIAALLLTSSACRSSDAFSRTPVAQREQAMLTVVDVCAGGDDSFEHDGTRYCPQGEALRVSIDDVELGSDDLGYPGVALALCEADAARTHAWSAKNVQRQIALIVQHEIVVVATLQAPLERHVLVNGGAAGFTMSEAVALRKKLRSQLAAGPVATR